MVRINNQINYFFICLIVVQLHILYFVIFDYFLLIIQLFFLILLFHYFQNVVQIFSNYFHFLIFFYFRHPEIEEVETAAITDMFSYAETQGWTKKDKENEK